MFRRDERMIQIKTDAEIAVMRAAGLVVGRTLETVRAAVAPGVTTAELDAIAEESIRQAGAVPSFKGYQGFPASICASVNEEIVHGIPGPKILREGDIISIDCGAIVEGYHGDAAVTVAVGSAPAELLELIRVCEDAMWQGLAAVQQGGRLSDIGHAIETSITSDGPYGIVREYTGHGIGTEMHQEPNVANFGRPGRGPRLEKGLALAVEPMVNQGSRHTRLLDDGWTVVTADGKRSAHFEHTVAVTEDGPWVLTALDGGASRLGQRPAGSAALA
ncbi:MAG: type I methionyl aminopeptidase [Actinomycetota bacterium]